MALCIQVPGCPGPPNTSLAMIDAEAGGRQVLWLSSAGRLLCQFLSRAGSLSVVAPTVVCRWGDSGPPWMGGAQSYPGSARAGGGFRLTPKGSWPQRVCPPLASFGMNHLNQVGETSFSQAQKDPRGTEPPKEGCGFEDWHSSLTRVMSWARSVFWPHVSCPLWGGLGSFEVWVTVEVAEVKTAARVPGLVWGSCSPCPMLLCVYGSDPGSKILEGRGPCKGYRTEHSWGLLSRKGRGCKKIDAPAGLAYGLSRPQVASPTHTIFVWPVRPAGLQGSVLRALPDPRQGTGTSSWASGPHRPLPVGLDFRHHPCQAWWPQRWPGRRSSEYEVSVLGAPLGKLLNLPGPQFPFL